MHSLGKIRLAFALLHFVLQSQTSLLLQVSLDFLLLHSSPLWRKGHLFLGVSSRRSCRSYTIVQFSSVTQSCPTLCDPMNHSTAGLPIQQSPGVHSDSHPSSRWCHPTISSSVVPFSSCPQSLLGIRVFSNESILPMRWPKYWSFSFSMIPSKEHPGLISFRMDLYR